MSEPTPEGSPGALDRALRVFADVRAGEGATVLLMCLNVYLLLVAYYILKTVREPLILATDVPEVLQRLTALGPLMPSTREAMAGPARNFRLPGFRGELGFISPMSGHHCRNCNRLRLTADGKLRPCLLAASELDLKEPMRLGLGDDLLGYLFQEAMELKIEKARFPLKSSFLPGRPMVSVGG